MFLNHFKFYCRSILNVPFSSIIFKAVCIIFYELDKPVTTAVTAILKIISCIYEN